MRVLKVDKVIRRSEAGVIIDITYDGELDDGTQVSRTLLAVQDRLLLFANPVEGVKQIVLEDLQRINAAHEAEKARKAALETLASSLETATIETPFEPEPVEEGSVEETVAEDETSIEETAAEEGIAETEEQSVEQ